MAIKKISGTTLDDLANMVARGFENSVSKDEFHSSLGKIETKLLEHDKRFNKLEYQIDEVKDIVERLEEGDILNLQKRVQILEKSVKTLANQAQK